jgi:YkoY family integral membrane protein
MTNLLQEIFNDPYSSLLIIGNLVVVESILSVDNAAVVATMVMDLPKQQRRKALKYGIFGAYLFRGLCLMLASFLVKVWWLKGIGGIYLIYLAWNWWRKRRKAQTGPETVDKQGSWLYRTTAAKIGALWATVISIEIMDLAFSIDNVFAAVAFSDNILLVLCGVFIGILAMRFVAQFFVALMEKYPFLEASAYLVIFLLGIKLSVSFYEHFNPASSLTMMLKSHEADWITSGITLGIIFVPIIIARVFRQRG